MNKQYNLSDYKLIVFDIDGTLVGSSHQLNTTTKEILLRLHQIGMPFTLATGKILPATRDQADELQIKLPLILSNGGVVQTREGEILFHSTLPLDITSKVIQICDEMDKDLVVYIDDRIYMKEMNDNISPVYSMVKSGLFEIDSWEKMDGLLAQINKCLIVDQNNPQNLKDLEEVFLNEFGDQADIVHTSTKLVEVLPKGVTKATAVKQLAEDMGINMSEVMAFGDYDNDAPLLAEAGLGICVENGSAAAKGAADLIIASCEENGPAKFLEKLMNAAE